MEKHNQWEIVSSQGLDGKIQSLIKMFLAGRNNLTLKAYHQDLESFTIALGEKSVALAVKRLISCFPGDANGLVLAYRNKMSENGLAPATINRRLAALRALIKLAKTLGIITWEIEIPNVKNESYRDLRGPGIFAIKKVVLSLSQSSIPKAKRDLAILRLLYDLGLRRNELVSLDLEHLDLSAGNVSILGKGRSGRVQLTLPMETKAALEVWISIRGNDPGPLFSNFDHNPKSKDKRLTGTGLYLLIRKYRLGRPHGIRHTAISEALDKTGGDVRSVRQFSRHRSVNTVLIYDDVRTDKAGSIAQILAKGL